LLTGNKVRKLEFLAADALNRGCTVLVTAGALQSNHCRATAAVAAQLGLKCELILRGHEQELSGNYLLSRLLDAEITYVSRGTTGDEMTSHLAEAHDRWAARGEKALTIPIGGSDEMGIWGYISAVEELMSDMQRHSLQRAAIVHATGSGGTQAGLNAGVLLHGLDADVISYAVCDDEAYFNDKAQADWDNLRANRTDLPNKPIKTLTNDQYIGPGYGRAGEEVFDTLAELAKLEGIALDPVYTGKAFYGLVTDLAKQAFPSESPDIIFMHTGGVFGIFPHASGVEAALGRA
jgi:D-cysteine desulfhydrase